MTCGRATTIAEPSKFDAFYSCEISFTCHRIASDEKEIDKLTPKAGLIEDSPRFQGIGIDCRPWQPSRRMPILLLCAPKRSKDKGGNSLAL
jgi:hypothetical protein